MKMVIKYALEREEEVKVDNINEAFIIANRNKKEGEVIVSVRSR